MSTAKEPQAGSTVFEGLRVLDLSPSRIGAQISQLFADFGAEVIWVEPPAARRSAARGVPVLGTRQAQHAAGLARGGG